MGSGAVEEFRFVFGTRPGRIVAVRGERGGGGDYHDAIICPIPSFSLPPANWIKRQKDNRFLLYDERSVVGDIVAFSNLLSLLLYSISVCRSFVAIALSFSYFLHPTSITNGHERHRRDSKKRKKRGQDAKNSIVSHIGTHNQICYFSIP